MTINDKIISVVNAAVENGKLSADLSPVSNDLKEYCLSKLNLDVDGFYHSIDSDSVRHLIKRHGTNSNDRNPITNQDFLLIPIIQKEYDEKWITRTKQGLDAITYVKRIVDTYYYVEEIRTGKKRFALKELRKDNRLKKTARK